MASYTTLFLVMILASFFSGGFTTKLKLTPMTRLHPSLKDYRGSVKPEAVNANQFMVNISLGDPPLPQLLAIDTGSNLLWVQCLPCNHCFKQFPPFFDPSKSSTYTNLSCTSPNCVVSPRCDNLNNCKFSLVYLDGTATYGVMGTEKLTFSTSDEGMVSVSDVLFGCGHESEGNDGEISGILGLGPQDISLVRKLGSKFSYCLGSIRDPNYAYNQLIIGNDAVLQGPSTPLEIYKSLYYLSMEGISVGRKRLNIDPVAFKRTRNGEGGVVIDSGSTLSFLSEAAYEPLRAEVMSLMDGLLQYIEDPLDMCYKGNIGRDLSRFPVVTFEFSGGVELGLDVQSLFQEIGDDEFCMAIRKSESMDDKLNVIGVMAQQNYNVGYDLVSSKIYFQRIDCQVL